MGFDFGFCYRDGQIGPLLQPEVKQQVPPLRFAPVGMTKFGGVVVNLIRPGKVQEER